MLYLCYSTLCKPHSWKLRNSLILYQLRSPVLESYACHCEQYYFDKILMTSLLSSLAMAIILWPRLNVINIKPSQICIAKLPYTILKSLPCNKLVSDIAIYKLLQIYMCMYKYILELDALAACKIIVGIDKLAT